MKICQTSFPRRSAINFLPFGASWSMRCASQVKSRKWKQVETSNNQRAETNLLPFRRLTLTTSFVDFKWCVFRECVTTNTWTFLSAKIESPLDPIFEWKTGDLEKSQKIYNWTLIPIQSQFTVLSESACILNLIRKAKGLRRNLTPIHIEK